MNDSYIVSHCGGNERIWRSAGRDGWDGWDDCEGIATDLGCVEGVVIVQARLARQHLKRQLIG